MAQPTVAHALRQIAMSHPDTEEGIACAGTVIEKVTVKVRKKAFLFLGRTDAMLKLDKSLAEAHRLAAKEPDHYKPGLGGWTKVTWDEGDSRPLAVMKRWIGESYRLQAENAPAKATKPRTAKKKKTTPRTHR